MNIDNIRVKPTLERLAYGYAMRQVLRRQRAFYSSDHRVFVLIVPDGSLFEYHLAATWMVQTMELQNRYEVVTPDENKKSGPDFAPVRLAFERAKSVLVLVESRMEIPRYVVAAADAVKDVGPLKPHHLAAASRSFHKLAMSKDQAVKLLEYPLAEVFAAVRADRPIWYALERLAAARGSGKSSPSPTGSTPKLETLSGFGAARKWGLDLAIDLAQWRAGKLDWRDVDGGVLLSGPPGTGKTMFASALAQTCNVSFVATSAAQWQSMGHLGDMLAAMRKSFRDAERNRPCILLIDEIDSIGDRSKFSGHNTQYQTEVVNALLECMDGSDRREGVVIIGATNHSDAIDPALRRAGRLDSHFELELPDYESRKGIASTYFDGQLSDEELGEIAAATEGYSGADFVKLARDARRVARKSALRISIRHVMAVLPPPSPIEGERRRRIAVHETGHAVIALISGLETLRSVHVAKETRGYGRLAGGMTYIDRASGVIRDKQSYLNEIAMRLGGMAAEVVILGSVSDGASGIDGSDIQQVVDIATVMETQLGMGKGIMHFRATTPQELEALRRTSPILCHRIEKLLSEQLERAKATIARHRDAVERIADALGKSGSLSGAEVAAMLQDSNGSDAVGSANRG